LIGVSERASGGVAISIVSAMGRGWREGPPGTAGIELHPAVLARLGYHAQTQAVPIERRHPLHVLGEDHRLSQVHGSSSIPVSSQRPSISGPDVLTSTARPEPHHALTPRSRHFGSGEENRQSPLTGNIDHQIRTVDGPPTRRTASHFSSNRSAMG
jgi:hypothetical protein